MSYADLAAFKAYLRIDDSVDDVELQLALDAATSEIDHLCSQTFPVVGEEPSTTYATPYRLTEPYGPWVVDVPVLSTADEFVLRAWNTTTEDWDVPITPDLASAGRPLGGPWTSIVLPSDSTYTPDLADPDGPASALQITGLFGYDEVPPAVVTACLIQAARVYKRRDSPFGMVNSLDGSEQTRLTRVVDPDVVVALRGYIKYWGAR